MMRKITILFAVMVFATTFLFLPIGTEAITKPFGGRVVMNFIPGVVCPGEGPITIFPAGISAPGPYAVTPGTIRHKFYTPAIGGWILGLHTVVAPVCYIPSPFGPIPFPAFPIVRFGASSPSF
jgi:hypothetical protein